MRVGDYEVQGELGRGGTGVVYRARAKDGRAVALKLLARATKGGARERFERERRLLASLGEAQGFVPLLDAGEEKGHPYLVMPLLEGGTLRARLNAGALSVEASVAVAEVLAGALAAAHALGIVHRDVKPENVLHDAAGRPFLADLGLAKHFASDSPGASQSVALSRSGQLLGTVGYMAPEQARDAKSAGPAADVFALGAILYECLTGWPAFEGPSLVAVLTKVENESPPPVANARPETPPWLAAVVERALARDPAARYPDGGALLDALRRRAAAERRRGRAVLPASTARRAFLAAPLLLAAALLAFAIARGPRAPEEAAREPGAAASAVSLAPGAGTLEGRIAAARARLEGAAAATSSLAPTDLLAARSPAAAALRALAARRAVPYALADAERLRALFPAERDASVLWAIAALGADPGARARAERTLEASPERTLAHDLARVARVVDAALEPRALLALPVSEGTVPRLVEYLRPLVRAPPASVDLAVAPLSEAIVAHALLLDPENRVTLDLVKVLGLVPDQMTPADVFPPRLVRASLVLGIDLGPEGQEPRARACESVAAETSDAVTRATALDEAVWSRAMAWRIGFPFSREALELDAGAAVRLGAVLEASGEVPATLRRSIRSKERLVVWMRVVEGRGDRAADLARGLALARDALRADATDSSAAVDLLRFSLESGSPDLAELSAAIEQAPGMTNEHDGVELACEVDRLSGRIAEALSAMDLVMSAEGMHGPHDRIHAVRALILVDQGQLTGARAELPRIPGPERGPPLLTRLARAAVERTIAARERR